MDMRMIKQYSEFLKGTEDLEEKVQISTNVSFESSQEDFIGLKDLDVEIVKKKNKVEPKIENIELRKSKPNRNSLF
jgi:hypothetical protein